MVNSRLVWCHDFFIKLHCQCWVDHWTDFLQSDWSFWQVSMVLLFHGLLSIWSARGGPTAGCCISSSNSCWITTYHKQVWWQSHSSPYYSYFRAFLVSNTIYCRSFALMFFDESVLPQWLPVSLGLNLIQDRRKLLFTGQLFFMLLFYALANELVT